MDAMGLLVDVKREQVEQYENAPEFVEVKPDVRLLLDTATGNGPHRCTACKETFQTVVQLTDHQRTHDTPRSKFYCAECNTNYSSKINLAIHLSSKLHHPEKRYQCGHCQKRFSLQIYLKRHKLCHVNTGSLFKCPECWKKFFRLSDFLIHQKRHKEKDYKCNVCYRNFTSKSMLELHKCGIRFECYCKKTFVTRKGLRLHQETHNIGNAYKCGECGKVFLVKRSLKAHMAYHRGLLEPLICDICYKKFSRKSSLRSHMKSHKVVQCEVCLQMFNRTLDLRLHRKIHMKVHPCDVCHRAFHCAANLTRHKLKHSKPDVPLDCKQCGAKFQYPSLLARHMGARHGKPSRHSCTSCQKTFLNSVDLTLHAKVHQPVQMTFDDSPGLVGYFNYNFNLV